MKRQVLVCSLRPYCKIPLSYRGLAVLLDDGLSLEEAAVHLGIPQRRVNALWAMLRGICQKGNFRLYLEQGHPVLGTFENFFRRKRPNKSHPEGEQCFFM